MRQDPGAPSTAGSASQKRATTGTNIRVPAKAAYLLPLDGELGLAAPQPVGAPGSRAPRLPAHGSSTRRSFGGPTDPKSNAGGASGILIAHIRRGRK